MKIKSSIIFTCAALITIPMFGYGIYKKYTYSSHINQEFIGDTILIAKHVDDINIIETFTDSINAISPEYKNILETFMSVYGNDGIWQPKDNQIVLKQPYTISDNCIKLIKQYEGCSLTAYYFTDNKTGKRETHPTIGYGHVIYRENGDNTPMKITQQQADELLKKDLEKTYVPAANRLLKQVNPNFKVTQGFFDGFVSLIYNCGISGIQKSAFWTRLKACRFDSKGNINKSDYEYMLAGVRTARVSSRGHITRRKAEYSMMRNS